MINSSQSPFVQLVAGVGWLVRNGKSYIYDSFNVEFDKTQEQANLWSFSQFLSARVAIGHDKLGAIKMVVIDGETRKRGMGLYELADFLVSLGFVNAINLDGGGSTTMVINGTLVGDVTDKCSVCQT